MPRDPGSERRTSQTPKAEAPREQQKKWQGGTKQEEEDAEERSGERGWGAANPGQQRPPPSGKAGSGQGSRKG
jgi:hypothetical protein